MAYNTPESVADYLSRFQMQVTERTKGTFSPMHVKYSLALKMGSSSFETTFQSNPNVHGEPTVTQVFGALASDAMLARDYGMDEFADELCADIKPSEAIRSYNSCKDTYNWMRDSLHLSNGDIASLSEVFGILPGADDGGYSLSGEAREAALSRFALPENRKAALDVIRKLNESRNSNDNAL